MCPFGGSQAGQELMLCVSSRLRIRDNYVVDLDQRIRCLQYEIAARDYTPKLNNVRSL
jgi:hypothetical protein